MIMKGRASRRLSMLGLVGLGMLAVASLPVWAAGTQQTPPPPPPASVPVVVTAPLPSVAQTLPPPGVPVPATAMTTVSQQVPPPPPRSAPPPSGAPQALPPSPATPAPKAATAYPSVSATAAPAALPPAGSGRPGAPAPAMAQTTTPVPAQGGRPRGAVSTATAPTAAQVMTRDLRVTYVGDATALPADAQTQVKSYQAERDALQQEIDRKLEAKRADLTKSLQALQEQYTKAGKLDEAVAIRDYIRSLTGGRVIYRQAR